MKKTLKEVFALALAALTVLVCVACSNPTAGPSDTTAAPSAQTTAAVDETTSLYVNDDLPEQLDLNKTITMLYWSDSENVEFFIEDEPLDGVENAIAKRNNLVFNRLNITVNFEGIKGNYENRADYEKHVSAAFSGGNPYDIYASYSMTTANCAYSGYCANLLDYSNIINFSKPWWPDKLTKEATINNKLYFASGDISTNMLYMMYVTFFSKQLVTDYNLDNPYDLVDNGKWTIDKMIEMGDAVSTEIESEDRTYGISFSSSVHYDPFYFGAGLRTVDRDSAGGLIISPDMGGEHAIATADKLREFLNNGKNMLTNGEETFRQGLALFTVNRARYASKKLADVDIGYGIIPMPKYNEEQSGYSSCLGFPHTLYAISSAAPEAEAAAYFLEAMASESYRTVTPALFEVSMKVRYADDPTAARMFDIIREGISFDVGRIYSDSLNKLTWNIFRYSLQNDTSYATDYSKQVNVLKLKLKTLLKQFDQ